MLLLASITVDGSDLAPLSQAVVACDRAVVSKAVADDSARHSRFLLDGFAEQQAIVAARADLAERRRKLREAVKAEKGGDTDAALALVQHGIEDRQQALDDARTLDRLKLEAVGYYRGLYIGRCSAKGA
ncbi:hypothetical protein [Sphingomonas bacterium]|uniref:hypothetical protein n=1 Tax=Sphingomonas bacterium TaxID=1895847 RepID=UPI001574FD08|nr:hypothetical protein [Sphingomonas bacterium]